MENSIDLSPEQEIARFIQSNYTPEYQADLAMAISVMYQFEHDGIQDTLCELLYAPGGEDSDALSVSFANTVEDSLKELVRMHGVTAEEATLSHHLEIMRGIYHVQGTEDPIPFLRIIEGNTQTAEEKLAAILASFSSYGEAYFIAILTEVEESLLTRLYLKLSEQESEQKDDEEEANQALIDNFKLFVHRYGKSNLGYMVVGMGVALGLPIASYLDYFTGHIDTTHPDTATMDLLSLFFLAEDTWQAPIEAYRTYSEQLINNVKDLQTIEDRMQRVYESFVQYKKATDDQASLPTV